LKDDNALADEVGEEDANEMQDEVRLKQMLGEKNAEFIDLEKEW
jgi:hypothetical protein